jgi:GDPmannose 4,6-dehydratase
MANMDALRDWGHAKDYVRMQWMMLQQDQPEDFVIATGVQYSVRQFIELPAAELGIKLRFEGQGVDEVAIIDSIAADKAPALKPGQVIVRIDPRYFRPTEVETLLGDPSKAKAKLGCAPEITVQQMCAEMVAHDLQVAHRHALLKANGYNVQVSLESYDANKKADSFLLTSSLVAEKKTAKLVDSTLQRDFFNQESPGLGETSVARKITRAPA